MVLIKDALSIRMHSGRNLLLVKGNRMENEKSMMQHLIGRI